MLGLALGGGGARGSAHVGVLRHLEEIGLRPQALSGTSAGSIIASLYAFGVPLDKISEGIAALKPTQLTAIRWGELGLMENPDLRELLVMHLGEKTDIREARIPLGIHVTDLENGLGVDLLEGPVVDAVLASCTVPGLYVPPKWGQRVFIDGGLTENVPFRALKTLGAKRLLGVSLNGQHNYIKPTTAVDVLMNAMDIAIDSQTRRQLISFDLVISMDLTRFSRTSARDHADLVQAGFERARERIPNRRIFYNLVRRGRLEKFIKLITPLKWPRLIKPKGD